MLLDAMVVSRRFDAMHRLWDVVIGTGWVVIVLGMQLFLW